MESAVESQKCSIRENFHSNLKSNFYDKDSVTLNTKGCCLICLKTVDSDQYQSSSNGCKTFPIQTLLKCLKVSSEISTALQNIKTESDGPKSIYEYEKTKKSSCLEVNGTLCVGCGAALESLSLLWLQLRKTQVEMDNLLERLSEAISGSYEDALLIQNYSLRMTSDAKSLRQIPVVDKLRKEIHKKSSSVRFAPQLQVKLLRLSDEDFPVAQSISPEEDYFSSPEAEAVLVFDEELVPELTSTSAPDPLESPPSSPSIPSSSTSRHKWKNKVRFNCETKKYKCLECFREFASNTGANGHYATIHLLKRFRCNLCKNKTKICTLHCNLMKHMKWIHGMERSSVRKGEHFTIVTKPNGNNQHQKTKVEKVKERRKKLKLTPTVGLRYSINSETGNWSCPKCPKEFKHQSSVYIHYQSVHLHKRFNCDRCGIEFRWFASMLSHKKTCDGLKKSEREASTTPTTRSDRYSFNTETGKWKCLKCALEFAQRSTVYKHYSSKHLLVIHKCELCGRDTFATPRMLEEHMKICKGVMKKHYRFPCRICGKIFKERWECRAHSMSCVGRIKYENKDDGVTSNEEKSKTTERTRAPKGSRVRFNIETGKWGCSKCCLEFTQRSNAFTHYRSIHLLIRHRCSFCDRDRFLSRKILEEHMKKCKGEMKRQFTFPCKLCGKIFKERWECRAHSMNCVGEFKSENNIAATASGSGPVRYSFNSQIRKWRKNKSTTSTPRASGSDSYSFNSQTGKWKCSKCPLEFTQRSSAFMHHRSKHLLVIYKCDFCDRDKFANRRMVEEHMKNCNGLMKRRHTYYCKNCGKKFTERWECRAHSMHCVVSRTESETKTKSSSSNGNSAASTLKSYRYTFNSVTGKWKCSKCPLEFIQRSSAFKHYSAKHLHIIHKCSFCDRDKFVSQRLLEKHMKNCKGDMKKRYTFACKICKRKFKERWACRAHTMECVVGETKSESFSSTMNDNNFEEEDNVEVDVEYENPTHFDAFGLEVEGEEEEMLILPNKVEDETMILPNSIIELSQDDHFLLGNQ